MNDPTEKHYLGTIEHPLGSHFMLVIAPSGTAAQFALQGRIEREPPYAGQAPHVQVLIQEIDYRTYASMAKHLQTLSLFSLAGGEAWSRELRVATRGGDVSYARTVWTARELDQVTRLMASGTEERMTQVRQHMNVDWLDRQGLVKQTPGRAQHSEVVVRPFAKALSFACSAGTGGHDVLQAVWLRYSDLNTLFDGGAAPVLFEAPPDAE